MATEQKTVECASYYCDGRYYAEVIGPDGEDLFSGSVGHLKDETAIREAQKIARKNGYAIKGAATP